MHKTQRFDLSETSFFSKLINDYSNGEEKTKEYITDFPSIDSIVEQSKRKKFDGEKRTVLAQVLKEQNSSFFPIYDKVKKNIDSLESSDTFTITTGHQLCFFGGPLYFLHKIAGVISISEELKAKGINAVPIFWMASEDHDFEEVNHFYLYSKKVTWEPTEGLGDAVGNIRVGNIDSILTQVKELLNKNPFTDEALELLKSAYQSSDNLAESTRKLVYSLFGEYGIVVLDANDRRLKKSFIEVMESDILKRQTKNEVQPIIDKLNAEYNSQAGVRDINFFYLGDNSRNRIEWTEEKYKVLNTELNFTHQEMKLEIEEFPERFSPNVILRPLYQDSVLPNLCYIGGGGEIAYWFQLKRLFEFHKVEFPILSVRNSFLFVSASQRKKMEELSLEIKDLFLSEHEFSAKVALLNEKEQTLEFSDEVKDINDAFDSLSRRLSSFDVNFQGMVGAEKNKTLKSIEMLEAKYKKALKSKHEVNINKALNLRKNLFPSNGLQERSENFLSFYSVLGKGFMEILIREYDAERASFNTIYLD